MVSSLSQTCIGNVRLSWNNLVTVTSDVRSNIFHLSAQISVINYRYVSHWNTGTPFPINPFSDQTQHLRWALFCNQIQQDGALSFMYSNTKTVHRHQIQWESISPSPSPSSKLSQRLPSSLSSLIILIIIIKNVWSQLDPAIPEGNDSEKQLG